jgi:hypothetical protein
VARDLTLFPVCRTCGTLLAAGSNITEALLAHHDYICRPASARPSAPTSASGRGSAGAAFANPARRT